MVSSELVEKILRLHRSQYRFKMKFSVKVFTFLLTVRLRGSTVEVAGTGPSEVTKTFAELYASYVERPTYFSTGTLCYSLLSTIGVSKRA